MEICRYLWHITSAINIISYFSNAKNLQVFFGHGPCFFGLSVVTYDPKTGRFVIECQFYLSHGKDLPVFGAIVQ